MDEEYKKALAAALRLINHHDRTEAELRSKLASKEVSEAVIDAVIARLTDEGFINDRRYAEYYITCYTGKRSSKRIEKELICKGIDRSIIEEYIDGCDDREAVKKALDKQLKKRGITSEDQLLWNDREKICAALARQGFDYDDIHFILDIICKKR